MGDNRKMCNKNCDKACTDLKLREKRRWKFYATNLATKPSPLKLGLIGEYCETIFFYR
jgi:hypothetical protein